jgi:hypothetical protein
MLLFIRGFRFRIAIGSDESRRAENWQDLFLGLANDQQTTPEATSYLVLGPFIGRKQIRACPLNEGDSECSGFTRLSRAHDYWACQYPCLENPSSIMYYFLCHMSGLCTLEEVAEDVLAMVAKFPSFPSPEGWYHLSPSDVKDVCSFSNSTVPVCSVWLRQRWFSQNVAARDLVV